MKNIRDILNINISESDLDSLEISIGKDEIISYIWNEKSNTIDLVLLSEEKLYYFENKNNRAKTNVYSLDEVIDIYAEQKKKFYEVTILLENKNKIIISNVDFSLARDFKDSFDNLSKSIEDIFLKSTKDDYINDLNKDKKNHNYSNNKERSNSYDKELYDAFNPKNKNQRIVDDNKISENTTFSSKYLNDLFVKRNVLMPNGTLNTLDKLWTKIDSLEINMISNQNEGNSKWELLESNLTKNSEEINKINQFISIGMKDTLDNNKKYFDEFIKSEFNFINQKLDSEIKKISNNNTSISEKINLIDEELKTKLLNIKEEQLLIIKDIKEALEDHKLNSNEIYVTQKAWIESNKLVKNNESSIQQLEDLFRKYISKMEETISLNKMNEEKINIIESNLNSFLDENIIFSKSISSRVDDLENNKFNSNNDLISNNYKEISNDIYELKKEINKLSQNNINNKNIIEQPTKKEKYIYNNSSTSVINTFVSKSYMIDGNKRYGLRSGQTIRIYTKNNEIGMDALYVSKSNNSHLDIFEYDGIIFKNKKYYFKIQDEFSLDNKIDCKINHVEYRNGIKIFKNYQLYINQDYIEYHVYDENGRLLNDAILSSSNYDLKTLTFFKD